VASLKRTIERVEGWRCRKGKEKKIYIARHLVSVSVKQIYNSEQAQEIIEHRYLYFLLYFCTGSVQEIIDFLQSVHITKNDKLKIK